MLSTLLVSTFVSISPIHDTSNTSAIQPAIRIATDTKHVHERNRPRRDRPGRAAPKISPACLSNICPSGDPLLDMLMESAG